MKKKLLCVEDEELNRKLLVQLLEEDYRLVLAANGYEAIAKAISEEPDLILMDLRLPVLNGWEATRRIKQNGNLSHIPIIAVTAHGMEGDEEKARAAGCDDFLLKPICENDLIKKIQLYLQE